MPESQIEKNLRGVLEEEHRDSSVERNTDEFRSRLVEAFARTLDVLDPSGTHLDALSGDPVEVGERAAELAVNAASLWREHLGPVYDTEGVRQLLGRPGEPISRQAVSQRRGLLALKTGSGQLVYPAFQFRGRGLVDGMSEVLSILDESLVSRWTVASWFVSPSDELGHQTPIALLADGYKRPVIRAARRWASALEY